MEFWDYLLWVFCSSCVLTVLICVATLGCLLDFFGLRFAFLICGFVVIVLIRSGVFLFVFGSFGWILCYRLIGDVFWVGFRLCSFVVAY